jgi:hypothetical protein
MAWTQADVLALERAIADGKGARSISFADHTVTFSSVDEMLRLLGTMRAAVAQAATPGTSTTRYASIGKGV